jgi:hypothetical protein
MAAPDGLLAALTTWHKEGVHKLTSVVEKHRAALAELIQNAEAELLQLVHPTEQEKHRSKRRAGGTKAVVSGQGRGGASAGHQAGPLRARLHGTLGSTQAGERSANRRLCKHHIAAPILLPTAQGLLPVRAEEPGEEEEDAGAVVGSCLAGQRHGRAQARVCASACCGPPSASLAILMPDVRPYTAHSP